MTAAVDMGMLARLRVATGVDVHPFVEGRELIIGGVHVPYDCGLAGHSDADVVAHAVTDAVLGGAGLADIGSLFPSEDPSLAGADSMVLLQRAMSSVRDAGAEIVSVDVVVIMQAPRLAPHRPEIIRNLAATLGVADTQVSVRATTTDQLGFVGRGEGAAAIATALMLTRER